MAFREPPSPASSLTALVDVELNRGDNNTRQSRNRQHKHQHQHQHQHQQQQQQHPYRHDWKKNRTSDPDQLAFFPPPLSPAPSSISTSPSFTTVLSLPSIQSSGHLSTSRRTPVPERHSPLHEYTLPPLPHVPALPHYNLRSFGPPSSSTGSGTTAGHNRNPLDFHHYSPYPQVPSRASSMVSPSSPTSASALNGSPNVSSGSSSSQFKDQNHFNSRENYPTRSFEGPVKYPTGQRQGLPGPPSPLSPTASTSTTLRHNSATFPSSPTLNAMYTTNSTTDSTTTSRRPSTSSRRQTFSPPKTAMVSKPRIRKYKNFFRQKNSDGTLRFLTYHEIEMVRLGRLAQFSNERLYLHWIRFGVLQGGIAVMLLSFGIGLAAYIGCGALLLALMTLIYATTLYHKRHLYMVTKRQDVDYYTRWIPTLLTVGLIVLYATNFALQLIYGMDARSPPPWTQQDDGNYSDAF